MYIAVLFYFMSLNKIFSFASLFFFLKREYVEF